MLLCKELSRRAGPSSCRCCTRAARPVGSVVNLCDGRQTRGDIEQGVQRRHSDLFPTLAEAAEFVAEVVTRYAR